MLNLICGPSGSGKSAYIAEEIRKDVINGVRCYLLIPEQQAYISERDLPKKLPENAGLYFKIVNFSGLCKDVFQKIGGINRISADQSTRTILMWEALRTISGSLLQYHKTSKSDLAFTENMLAAVEELQNSGVTGEQLENAAKALPENTPLRNKLADISLIRAAYTMLLEQRFENTAADELLLLAEMLKQHNFFAGAKLYIDSFTSFTMPEYAVLTEVIRQSQSVTIGMCIDSLSNPSIQFLSVYKTLKRLKKYADKANSSVEIKKLSAENNCRPEALLTLERDLWRFDLRKEDRVIPTDQGENCVYLRTCSNLYEESETTALTILDLVMNGYHYGDIAIFIRDPESYRDILDAALERHHIPCFFSDRTELSAKPLARLIFSALRAVSRNYRLQDIITLVKTGLCGVSERESALFEEYCETWQINGKRFCDPVWNMNPDGLVKERSSRADEILEIANRVREMVVNPLQSLAADLRQSKTVGEHCRTLYDYLQKIQVADQLSALAQNELLLGEVREAGESLRLYDFLNETLLKLSNLLPDSAVSVDEFYALLQLAFSHSDLGSVPGLHDCVMIGSAATVRAEGVQVAFLLGLCEGDFPKSVQDSGILSDADKKVLECLNVHFDSDQNLRSSEELLYVYRAITKPLQKLYLSAPLCDVSGSNKAPSLAMKRVCFLLDRKPIDVCLYQLMQQEANDSNEKQELPPLNIEKKELFLSKSSIKTFVLCPYSYYSKSVLKLREKKGSETTVSNDGVYVHFILEKFLSAMLDEQGTLHFPESDEEMHAIVSKITLEYFKSIISLPINELDPHLIHLFQRLQNTTLSLLLAIKDELARGQFIPTFFEQNLNGGSIPDLKIELVNGKTVHLTGQIDRVDLFRKGELVYVRVVDYKTGSQQFSLREVEKGLDMQLIIYLYAATQAGDHFVPAGANYLAKGKKKDKTPVSRSGIILDDEDVLNAVDPIADSELRKDLKKMTNVEINQLIETVKSNITEIAMQIYSGDLTKTPSNDACKYCTVRDNCNLATRPKDY